MKDTNNSQVATPSSSFIFGSSSSSYLGNSTFDSTSEPLSTTQYLNILSSNADGKLTTIQHFNDIATAKNTNVGSNNLHQPENGDLLASRKECSKSSWSSFRNRSGKEEAQPTSNKIANKYRLKNKPVNINILDEISTVHGKIDDEFELNEKKAEKECNLSSQINSLSCPSESPAQCSALDIPYVVNREDSSEWDKPKWRTKLSLRDKKNAFRSKSLKPATIRKKSFWSSFNRSTDVSSTQKQASEFNSKVRICVNCFYGI